MTAHLTQTAGAASHDEVNWHTIDWSKAHQTVRRLQARIVKATEAGKWGKVKALQHLLTRSFSGKALAVLRVTTNRGKRTPGVDGISWDTPQKKATAIRHLRHRGYRPKPLRRVYIPKQNGKKRPLGIPTMQDRAMQALHLLALDPIAETTADPNSYGFRQGRQAADALEQCFKVLARNDRAEWVLEGDIKGCFDNISHEWLLAHIPMDKAILSKWLKVGYMDRHVLHPTTAGTPQGGICSPVLANLTLDGLENHLKRLKVQGGKINVVRFADDFIVTGSSKDLLEMVIKPAIERFMQERGLELSQEKTSITHIGDGFDFLGKTVRKYNGKLLITPSKANVKTFLGKIREIVKANRQTTAGNLVALLNPAIRGWANYHCHDVSKATFSYVDYAIFTILWRWAKRRHPTKGQRWIRKKYFRTNEGRTWTFFGERKEADDTHRYALLVYASDTPIRRHTKIIGAANPYNPAWEPYFTKRLGVKMRADLYQRRLLWLWNEQQGICPVCSQPITTLTQWHRHHIQERQAGGGNETENLLLLHPNCHNKVHSQHLVITKPRPQEGE